MLIQKHQESKDGEVEQEREGSNEEKGSVASEERTKYVAQDAISVGNMKPLSGCSKNTIFLTCYISGCCC